MKNSYVSIIILALILSLNFVHAQVSSTLAIANEQSSGGNYLFDIYLTTASGSSGDLYLGNSDFRLDFNGAAFSNPALTVVSGYCTLVPTLPGASNINNLITQANYTNNMSTTIQSGELVINLAGPTPGNVSAFESSVAKIDGTASTHRLGRFQVSGYLGGSVDLSWEMSAALKTLVYTLSSDAVGPPPFASSLVTIQNTALPVTLQYFTAFPLENQAVLLKWSTGSEIGNDHFVIEKKRGSQPFQAIAQVEGKGNEEAGVPYQYLDHSEMEALNYYRLKQVDTDGSFVYSHVIEVRMEFSLEAKVYPNPFQDRIFIETRGKVDEEVRFALFDMTGREVLRDRIRNQGSSAFEIPTGHIPSGTYAYKVQSGMEIFTGKLIK